MNDIISIGNKVVLYLDTHQGLLTVILTLLGWCVLLWLGLYHSKKSLRNEARLKIYEDLMSVKNRLDKSFSLDLATKITSYSLQRVIDDMEHFDSDKKYLITSGIHENSYMYWNLYFRELSNFIGDSNEDILLYYTRMEMWIGIIPELKEVRDLWLEKTTELYTKLWSYNQKHIATPIGAKDQSWKQNALKEIDELRTELDKVTGYTEDLNILIHDHLLAPIFKYKKKERDLSFITRDMEYIALTKKGFIQKKHRAKKVNKPKK